MILPRAQWIFFLFGSVIILLIINLVVITKGAGRVSEVSARFTLDALPGKQMAIDADIAAGLMTAEEAKAMAAADAAGGHALQPEERLALHVLCELAKGTTSAWAPYLRSLPARYDTLAHFSADCAAELQASWAVSLARAEARRVGLSATRARPARAPLPP